MSERKIDYTKVPSTKTLAGNTIWNLIGMGLPIIAGLIAFPIMKSEELGLGNEKLEIFGLVWMFVGFTSIFDMGIGRALTRAFSEKLATNKTSELPGLFWTAFSMIIVMGVIAGVGIFFSRSLVTGDIEPLLQAQANRAFLYVSLAMPIIILNVGMCGVLQARQHFKLLNLIRIPAGSYTFLSPLCVFPFTRDISVVALVLIIGRMIEMVCYTAACFRSDPSLVKSIKFENAEVRELVRFGGWMTVSNVVVGFVTHINRFIIRMICKLGEGTFYLIPEEVVVRVLMIPKAWIDVLFPAFVTSFESEEENPTELFEKGVLYLTLVMMPVTMVLYVIAPDFFAVWLPEGEEFAARSMFIVRCLTLGVFVHSIGRVVWYFLQAAGRPDLAAKFHLVMLPAYMGGAYLLVRNLGIDGAAIAWTARVALDLLILSLLSAQFLDSPAKVLLKLFAAMSVAAVLIFISALPEAPLYRIGLGLAGIAVFYVIGWLFILTGKEKSELLTFIRLKLKRS